MNQPNHLPRRPHPALHIPTHKHLPPPLPAHQRRHLLELPARALPLHPHRLLGHLIPKQPTRIPPAPQHEFRVRFLRLHNRELDVMMNGRLDRTHEPRPHIDPLRPQRQRRRHPLPVREPARRNERRPRFQALPRPRQQYEVRNVALAHVPGALEAVDGEEIDAEVHGALRVPDRGAFVQHGAAGGFELADHGAGAVAGCFDDCDAGVYDCLGVGGVVGGDEGGEEGEVDAEGVGGEGLAALDFGAEGGGGGLG